MEVFAVAHEYGHHHLSHGRGIDDDPKEEEFAADQFALKIVYEVERTPLLFDNPYLSSGAGGTILLMALKTLTRVRTVVTGEPAKPNNTALRALLIGDSFVWFHGLCRTAANRLNSGRGGGRNKVTSLSAKP